jgi:hypothetical protein
MRDAGFVECVRINVYRLVVGKSEGNSQFRRDKLRWTIILDQM